MTVSKDNNPKRTKWQAVLRTLRPVRNYASAAWSAVAHFVRPTGEAGKNRFRRAAIIVAVVGLIGIIAGIGGKQYVKANTVDYYNVLMDGQLVGSVDKPETVENMLLAKADEVKQEHPDVNMVLDTSKVSYEPASGYKAKPETDATLDKLSGMLTAYATGVEVKIDGEVVGIVKDRETADKIMQRVKNKFAPELASKRSEEVTTLSYSSDSTSAKNVSSNDDNTGTQRKVKKADIVEKVTTSAVEVDPSKVMDEKTLYKKIVTGNTETMKYTVKEGDCVGCIAQKFDIPKQVIYQNNPWINDDFIKIGDVLDLTVQKPAVTVRTVESVSEIVNTDPQVVIRTSDSMRKGESKVIQQGSGGQKRLTYRLTKDNGYLISEELIGYEVLKKGTPKIIVKGTKVVLGEGSGSFAWPVSNHTMTSSFGKRWGKQHEGLDLVGSSTIKASDNGVVEFAGVKNGYGNVVIIDHKNGYKTLYGHMKSISVKEGQTVEKGEKLGIMGSTGRSTGTHLHFEIQKNGVPQNPMKYL
ncbi:M23 family metallopeptidase [Paenibacillus xylaniclasticus]|uniref:M23 family metallopeptidase n=1 Tax=Paenibacillus xylaniclasticus TaxID=588083 RepID=UPI000FDA9330|nr:MULTISPECIES: M23 family metallopeptidase [Paenibacillus]GFN31329.1 metalloendopeptidase [Paenibacillus curdlanolyticus]